MAKYFNIMPKWWNFAKSGHTDSEQQKSEQSKDKVNNYVFRLFFSMNIDHPTQVHIWLESNPGRLRWQSQTGSFTLAAAVCRFRSRLCQCKDRNFCISLHQHNCLLHHQTQLVWMSHFLQKLNYSSTRQFYHFVKTSMLSIQWLWNISFCVNAALSVRIF